MADDEVFYSDVDRFTIGFTEIQYQASRELVHHQNSEEKRVYSSPALHYAARSNCGESKTLQDQSGHIEKQRGRSVSKIQNDMLGLVFELSERKRASPTLPRPQTVPDFHADTARSSFSSVGSADSALSTIITVQQLPPKGRPCSFPERTSSTVNVTSSKTKKFSLIKNKKESLHEHDNCVLAHLKGKPKSSKVMNNDITGEDSDNSQVKVNITNKSEFENNDVNGCSMNSNTASILKSITLADNASPPGKNTEIPRRSQVVFRDLPRRRSTEEKLSNLDQNYIRYRFQNRSSLPKRRVAFCHGTYIERSERERMDNIRRRHISQTNTGSLDFNKIKKQLIFGGATLT